MRFRASVNRESFGWQLLAATKHKQPNLPLGMDLLMFFLHGGWDQACCPLSCCISQAQIPRDCDAAASRAEPYRVPKTRCGRFDVSHHLCCVFLPHLLQASPAYLCCKTFRRCPSSSLLYLCCCPQTTVPVDAGSTVSNSVRLNSPLGLKTSSASPISRPTTLISRSSFGPFADPIQSESLAGTGMSWDSGMGGSLESACLALERLYCCLSRPDSHGDLRPNPVRSVRWHSRKTWETSIVHRHQLVANGEDSCTRYPSYMRRQQPR